MSDGFIEPPSGSRTLGLSPLPPPPQPPSAPSTPTIPFSPARDGREALPTLSLPPGAEVVIEHIMGAEGTLGRNSGFVLYGGEPFTPGRDHPGRFGATGPTGQPTSAAGPGQWEQATWEDEKRRFAARGLQLDFSNPQHQHLAMWDRASQIYREKTGRDLAADNQAGKVEYSALSSEWTGLAGGSLQERHAQLSPEVRSVLDAKRETMQRLLDDDKQFIEEYHRQANAATPGSAERQRLIDQIREREYQYEQRWYELTQHPPIERAADLWSGFGSAAMILSLLGGLFAKHHLTAALTAAGSTLQAIKANNHQEFEKQYKIWRDQSTLGLDLIKVQNEDIRALLEDKGVDEQERLSRLSTFFREHEMRHQDQLLAAGQYDDVLKSITAAEHLYGTARAQSDLISLQNNQVLRNQFISQGMDPTEAQIRADSISPRPGLPRITATGQRTSDIKAEIDRRNSQWDIQHPNATEDERQKARFEISKNVQAEMASSVRVPRSASAMYIQQFRKDYREKWGEDPSAEEIAKASARYTRALTIERAFAGSGQTAQQMQRLNTVADHLGTLRQLAIELNTGNLQRANQLLQVYARETGASDITNFNLGATLTADEIVRLITVSGGTLADRQDMQRNFAARGSPVQLSQAVDVSEDFVYGRFKALEQQYARNDPGRQKEFVNEMLVPEARAMMERVGEARERGQRVPTQHTLQYNSADDVKRAYQTNQITWDQAAKILRDHGWAQ